MKIIIIILVIVVVAVAGWMILGKGTIPSYSTAPSGNTDVKASPADAMPTNEVEVPINSQNSSNELGTAVLKEENGKTIVTVNLKGQPAGSSQPAHIHLGACPNPGVVKYPLTPIENGTSVTTLDTTKADLMKLGPLAVNVHESSSKMTNYVACGDIKF